MVLTTKDGIAESSVAKDGGRVNRMLACIVNWMVTLCMVTLCTAYFLDISPLTCYNTCLWYQTLKNGVNSMKDKAVAVHCSSFFDS